MNALSRVQRTAIPRRQDLSSSVRFRDIPIPCPEHLPSCPEPSPLARRLLRSIVRGVPSRLPRTYPFAFSPQRSAFSTLRRFLPARHSLGTCPREPAPEWCRDTSNRRLPPNSSLPNCTRAHVARIGSRTRIRSIRGAVRFTPSNPLQRDRSLSRRVIRSSIAWRPSPLASPVAIPVLVLRPLSRTRAILNRRGHFCESRRDALPAFVTRDAFRQSRFERLPPCGVGRPLRDARLESRWPQRLRLLDPRWRFPFAFAGSCSPFSAREVFPRG